MIPLHVREFGRVNYEVTWRAMDAFTEARDESSPDELWLVEHDAVFTLGQAGKEEHLLNTGSIPVIRCDRGGQVTYHGPGQIIIYTLIDLRRRSIGIRDFVMLLEDAVIATLARYQIEGRASRDAPGVYVDSSKIAALGLRVRRGCTFHGLALNVDMDLTPFSMINPCGYAGLNVTSTQEVGIEADRSVLARVLMNELKIRLSA